MEKTFRVAVEYKETRIRKPMIISFQDDKTTMLNLALDLFSISQQDSQDYKLFIQILNCEVENAQTLINNEILILKNMKNDVKIEDEKFLNMNELKADLDYNVLKDDMSYISANQSNEIISEKEEERKRRKFI